VRNKSILTNEKISQKFAEEEKRERMEILKNLSFREKAKIVEELIDFGREILKAKKMLAKWKKTV